MTHDERIARVCDELHTTLNNYKNSYLNQDEVVQVAIAASDATLEVTDEAVDAAAVLLWQSRFDHPNALTDPFFWNDFPEDQKQIYRSMARGMICISLKVMRGDA